MTVIIPKKAYQTIVAATVRFANKNIPFDDWIEASGVFIGKNKGKDVIISEACPIMHQKLDKNAVIDQYVWSDEDYESLYIIDDEAFAREEFTVGWWHSHPGMKLMMSHLDIQTSLSYQTNNPLAICLVFNPTRLLNQAEPADKKGDPEIKLEDDPGFIITSLDDISFGAASTYHEVEYKVEGYESMGQLVFQTQDFIKDIISVFPTGNVFKFYEAFVDGRLKKLDAMISGTEEYLKTLGFKGEAHRIPEVLERQTKDINRFVAETFMKIENVKDCMDFLEYKERATVIPQLKEILTRFDEAIIVYQQKIKELSNK
jgi:proteasome lid subunit RPN8/RPN11